MGHGRPERLIKSHFNSSESFFFPLFFKFGEDDFLMIAMLMMLFDSHGDAGTRHEVGMCPLYNVVT